MEVGYDSKYLHMPVAAPQKSRLHAEDRRRLLLKAAIESFAQKGFSGTKTKDIAAAAGVSEAILFRHFASKEDLYHAILDAKEAPDARNQFMKELDALASRRDDTRFFLTLANGVVSSFRDDPAFHRLLLYASLEGHLLASLFRARFGLPMGNFLRRYIALRQKEGAFHRGNPDTAMEFFFGVIVQYALSRYLFGIKNPALDEETVVKELVTLAMRGLKK
jgi:TetR/AcrR family transcriptional regulator